MDCIKVGILFYILCICLNDEVVVFDDWLYVIFDWVNNSYLFNIFFFLSGGFIMKKMFRFRRLRFVFFNIVVYLIGLVRKLGV